MDLNCTMLGHDQSLIYFYLIIQLRYLLTVNDE